MTIIAKAADMVTMPNPTASPLALLQLAIDKGTDPDKLGKLMDLAERWEANQAAAAFAESLAEFQAECPRITKGRTAKGEGNWGGFKFASYDDIDAVIRPILARCGLSVSFTSETIDGGKLKLTCRLQHGKHAQDTVIAVPVPQMKVNETQKYGAAVSYARRYALCAALNIVVTDEDTDAHGVEETITEQQVLELEERLEETRTDIKRFKAWAGIENLKDLPVGKFADAIGFFDRKVKGGGK